MKHLKPIGKILPKKSIDIEYSPIGLGFEKLDRDVFDPEKAYPFVAESGVKWARLQSGWQKTERKKGVYNFLWLDKIVDNLLNIGVEPWLCLCYGNDLYTEQAKEIYCGVGCPPIHSHEEKIAWQAYVKATVSHFKGRIHFYEIWNEPDGEWCWKHGVSATELAEFIKETATACKLADDSCEVIGFSTCLADPDFHNSLCENGVCDYIDAITYHAYGVKDSDFISKFEFYDEIRKNYAPNCKLIQGESGPQSRDDGCGAIWCGTWNEAKQTKLLLRHLITDIGLGVYFTSYFSCMDMAEALHGNPNDIASISDFGYFGVVGAEFDENAKATSNYSKKPSFYALQNLCSILCNDFTTIKLEIEPIKEFSWHMYSDNYDFAEASVYSFNRHDGSTALFYWVPGNVLSQTFDGETSFKISAEGLSSDIKLVDITTGNIYELNNDRYSFEKGFHVFKNIPISDSPLLLMFGNFYNEK